MIILTYPLEKIRGAFYAAKDSCKFCGYKDIKEIHFPEDVDVMYHWEEVGYSRKGFETFMRRIEDELLAYPRSTLEFQRRLTRNLRAIKPVFVDLGWKDRQKHFNYLSECCLREALFQKYWKYR